MRRDIYARIAARYAFEVFAMSRDEALHTLGFSKYDNPTPEEISKAYKLKALENHPDRGGDPAKMVAVNVAKDTLTKGGGPSKPYSPPKPPAPKVDFTVPGVPFATAMMQVPSGVSWFAISQQSLGYTDSSMANVSEYYDDKSSRVKYTGILSTIGVFYGRTKTAHVFLAVKLRYGIIYKDAETGKTTRLEENYEVNVETVPLSQDISSNYMQHFQSVASFWSDYVYESPLQDVFGFYNSSKITEDAVIHGGHTKAVPFIKILKTIKGDPQENASLADIKKIPITVKWVLSQEKIARRPHWTYQGYDYFILVGSKAFELSDATIEKFSKIIIPIFLGQPKYDGSKIITRMKESGTIVPKSVSDVLKRLAENLTTEDPWLKDFLLKASKAWERPA